MRTLAKGVAVLASALGAFLFVAATGFWITIGLFDGSTDLGSPIGFGAMIVLVSLLLSIYVACVLTARLFAGMGLREFFLGTREA